MRLSNRIAATALAAVMAVSMLTACGGGGGGSTGGSTGGNGGGRPDSAMGGAGDPEKIAEALTRLPELI